jgi:hypothetical protein
MSTSPLLSIAENWERVYTAFEQVNFTAYDYESVKQSLLDYLKFNYPENFNDYIESSQLIALIEMFAYIAELLSYRVDLSVHENLLPTATRKQSILRLAKLISYTASRNVPLRGLVKINSVSCSEDVRDSQGNSLANRVIKWNDSNNPLWREQFFAVIGKVLTQRFGNPFKNIQIDDTIFSQYEFQNVVETETDRSAFRNGVLKLKVNVNGNDLPFEIVPADIDSDGIFERSPNPNTYFTVLYSDDGYGDASDTSGFMMYLKQGVLGKYTYVFDSSLPNRSLDINVQNINDVDVWVQNVDDRGVIVSEWQNVPNIAGTNLAFNNLASSNKYEIETLEDDKIRLIFGDGDFADIPTGVFNIWARQSTSGEITITKNQIQNVPVSFLYTSKTGKHESCSLSYSLVGALQNSALPEDIEHIRSVAPSVYYTQNRMVNGEDYNSFFLKDSSILRLKAINRTFAGQPKYLDWNDASGRYQNVKIFGNDLRMYFDITASTESSQISSRSLIDSVIEPALSDSGINNLILYQYYLSGSPISNSYIIPRNKFIEDLSQDVYGIPLLEKTKIQGALDRHYYGEPDFTVMLDINLSDTSALPKIPYAVVNSDTDQLIYDTNLKMVTKDYIQGTYSLVNTSGNISGIQESAIRQKRFGIKFIPDRPFSSILRINQAYQDPTAMPDTDFLTSDDFVQQLAIEETYTIEVVNADGTLSIHGSVSGEQPAGIIGSVYSNGVISFLIAPVNGEVIEYVLGDAFIIDVKTVSGVFTPLIYKKNLSGWFDLVNESDLLSNSESIDFDPNLPAANWLMIVERVDNDLGNLSYWKITKRNFTLTVESPTTKFFFDRDTSLVDPDTKTKVFDSIRLLKSNLDVSRTKVIGTDQIYNVVGDVKFNDGETNFNALSVMLNQNITTTHSYEFLRFIASGDYVYFITDAATGRLVPVAPTPYIVNIGYLNNVGGPYVRKQGRDNLDFMWQHFTPDDHLIDPSVSNIIDVYVLTRGYYSLIQKHLNGLIATEPRPPTSLELRTTYRNLIESKMISDSVIMHSGVCKLLFGNKAVAELRAKFRVVKSDTAKLTSDQIRSRILDIVNSYFSIDNWDFGQSFYATELCAVIHKTLPTEIASVVLVPEFPTNYFGDLFYLRSAPDEVFTSCATIENIEIVSGLDRVTLKQKV